MKNIKALYYMLICTSVVICTEDISLERAELIQNIEQKCHLVIDDIFAQASTSIAAQEDIMKPEWFKRKNIMDIQNLMSDACIVLFFDNNIENVIPERLQEYLQHKIRDEAQKVFNIEQVSLKQARQFFGLSEIVCALSQGTDCRGMISTIKNENILSYQKLKKQKKARQKAKKDAAHRLRESIILGARQQD